MIMARGNAAGKLVVITGVARGLGRALAEGFAAEGHRVVGCSRSKNKIAELEKALGHSHSFSVVDVRDDDAVRDWASTAIQEYGAPDLLLNNAAVINKSKFLWDVSAAEFDVVVDTNIKGVTNVIRHFLPSMAREQKRGDREFQLRLGAFDHRRRLRRIAPPSGRLRGSRNRWRRSCRREWRRCRLIRALSIRKCCAVVSGHRRRIFFRQQNGRRRRFHFYWAWEHSIMGNH